MCAILREDTIRLDSRFRVFFEILPTSPIFEMERWLFLNGSKKNESKIRAPHRGTSLGPKVCGANKGRNHRYSGAAAFETDIGVNSLEIPWGCDLLSTPRLIRVRRVVVCHPRPICLGFNLTC
jgi:hypothetical protein